MAGSGVNLATAYVTLTPTTKGIGGAIDEAFGGAEESAKKAGEKSGQGLVSRLGGVLKTGVLAVGAAAGGVLATSLFKGWTRLGNIENAQAKLAGLGHSAESVQSIMDNALASVKGTAFGLDEAATVAAGAVASGIKPGQDLTRILSLVGDAATIGGTSMGEMGAIFNKVAASGKLQGDVIAQLGDKGIPILQLLGEQIGKTPQEVAKLASEGKINFETFAAAMEDGLGGAALKSGETTQGAFKNMGAALGRFGAQLLKDVFPLAKTVFGGITGLLDKATAAAGPFVESVSGRIGPAMERLSGAVSGLFALFARGDYTAGLGAALGVDEDSKVIDRLFLARDELGRLGGVFSSLWGSAQKLGTPIRDILASLGQASAAIGISTWQIFIVALETAADLVAAYLVPAITRLSEWMKDNQTTVTLAAGAFVVYRLAVNAISFARLLIGLAQTAAAFVTTKLAAVRSAASTVAAWVASAAQTVAIWSMYAAQAVASAARTAAAWVASSARTVVALAVMAGQFIAQGAVMVASTAVAVARVVAGWVLMGVQSMIQAGRMAAAWVIAMGPIGWVIAAVVAIVALIVANWDKVKEWTGKAWDWVVQKVVGAWEWLKEAVSSGVSNVVGFVTGLPGRILGALGNFGRLLFDKGVDLMRGLVDGIASAAQFVGNVAKNIVNAVIRFINRNLIDGINDLLEFTIAGITINPPDIPHIPLLAEGGVTTGPTLAMIGEGKEQEAVLPLSKLEALIAVPRGDGGGRPVQIDVHPREGIDLPALARQVARELSWSMA